MSWDYKLVEKFQYWFFYTLMFAPGVLYLEYVEKINLSSYSGFLIIILLIKILFFGFLYLQLALIFYSLDKKFKSKDKETIRFWDIINDFRNRDRFEVLIVFSNLFFIFSYIPYYFLPDYDINLPSFNLIGEGVVKWWILYTIFLIFFIILHIFLDVKNKISST